MKILVSDGDYKHTLGIVRALGRKGHSVDVFYDSKTCLCKGSVYTNKSFKLPKYLDLEFDNAFLKIIIENRYDVIFPVGSNAFQKLLSLESKIRYRQYCCTN